MESAGITPEHIVHTDKVLHPDDAADGLYLHAYEPVKS
jgi:hypothetical protein